MTHMFYRGVAEKIIRENSGHQSVEMLRGYEHPSVALGKAAGEVIADLTKRFKPDIKPVIKQEPQLTPALPGLILWQHGQLHH